MAKAKGTFHVTDWDEKTCQELGGPAAHGPDGTYTFGLATD